MKGTSVDPLPSAAAVKRRRRFVPVVLALAITAYGAVLRLDALVEKYGTVDHPGWARVLTHRVAPAGSALRPFALGWPPINPPYVGGDPINYLAYAREMRGFYQAHLREPVFLALTRACLWLLANQDIAVSFASLIGSSLAIFGTYLLGARLMPVPAALLAALVMAIERENITWAPDGWRDDTFTAAVLFAAWALLRLSSRRSMANAVLVGITAATAVLTRITAVSFILPALLWVVVASPAAARRAAIRPVALALVTLSALIAPYLVNCAIEFHDPLVAINYHTGYYRYGEGLPADKPMSARDYLREKVARAPVATIDTALVGLFVEPFRTKWNGLEGIARWMRPILYWSACAGLMMLLFNPAGRLLLVILVTSLLPYIFTWNIGGGGEWRFTMHAYPFFIVAAFYALAWLAGAAQRAWLERSMPSWAEVRPRLVRTAAVAAVVAAGCGLYLAMPWLVVREVLARGHDATVGAGPRDGTFFRRGWSPPHADGTVTARVSLADRAVVWIPLPARRAYDVVLRFDPVSPELQHRVVVLLNQHVIAQLNVGWDPQRVGGYRVQFPEQYVKAGANELALVPDVLVPRAAAGARFEWVPGGEHFGVRLWHVRLLP
jgi:hypothetical protein